MRWSKDPHHTMVFFGQLQRALRFIHVDEGIGHLTLADIVNDDAGAVVGLFVVDALLYILYI